MARAVVLAPIDWDFAKEVSALAKEGQKLIDGYASLTAQMLVFAQDFKRLWDRAAKLDGADTGKHHNHLRQAVSELIQTSNKSIRSRWITIGSQAKKLMHYKDALPPYRDSLYEIALALQDEKPVTKWVNAKQLTIDSSVREVRSLRGGKKRTKRTSKPAIKVRRSYPATISISFETYSAAAETVSARRAIQTNPPPIESVQGIASKSSPRSIRRAFLKIFFRKSRLIPEFADSLI